MKRESYLLGLILGFSIIFVKNSYAKYKICVTETHPSFEDCRKLDENESKFVCVTVSGVTDCAFKMERGEVDLGIFTAEEVILVSKFDTHEQLVVIGEIRSNDRLEENFQFETVAIVEKENFHGNLDDLKGKKFCHPGFNRPQKWTDRVLKHFESMVLKVSGAECVKSVGTAVEDELSALSSFFASSCRPGKWADDPYWDMKLKRKYSKLCELCDSKRECSLNLHAHGNQEATLHCLTEGNGSVAYVENHYVQQKYEYFTDQGHGHYKYLCPNGAVQDIPNKRPCTWLQQPWDSIIAKDKGTAKGVTDILNSGVVPTGLKARALSVSKWKPALQRLLLGQRTRLFLYMDNNTLLKGFIQNGREIPETVSTVHCHKQIKWCTTSETENNKCEWLRQAAIIQGVVPELQCVQGTSHLDCFKKINMTEADIVGTNSNLGPIATHFFNLTTVAYQETEENGSFKVVAVVNRNLAATAMMGLKDKKACFPEFAGLAWIAFVEAIRNSPQSESEVCPYDNSTGTFFASICAPGSKDLLNGSEDSHLCDLCNEAYANISYGQTGSKDMLLRDKESCDATTDNKLYGDAGALYCLSSGVADVAFINAYSLPMILENMPGDFTQNYRIMCHNGTKVDFTSNLDDECFLTVVTGGEVVARGSRTEDESRDISLILLKLDELFGIDGQYKNMFNLYKPFNDTKDLLFRGEAFGFVTFPHINEVASVASYAHLKHNAENCRHPKQEQVRSSSGVVGKTALFLTVILKCLLF